MLLLVLSQLTLNQLTGVIIPDFSYGGLFGLASILKSLMGTNAPVLMQEFPLLAKVNDLVVASRRLVSILTQPLR